MAEPFKNMLQQGRNNAPKALARGRGRSASSSGGRTPFEAQLTSGMNQNPPRIPQRSGIVAGLAGAGPGGDTVGGKSPGSRRLAVPSSDSLDQNPRVHDALRNH